MAETPDRENHEDNNTAKPEQVESADTKVDTGEHENPHRVLLKGELHSPDGSPGGDADLDKKFGAKVVTIKGTT